MLLVAWGWEAVGPMPSDPPVPGVIHKDLKPDNLVPRDNAKRGRGEAPKGFFGKEHALHRSEKASESWGQSTVSSLRYHSVQDVPPRSCPKQCPGMMGSCAVWILVHGQN